MRALRKKRAARQISQHQLDRFTAFADKRVCSATSHSVSCGVARICRQTRTGRTAVFDRATPPNNYGELTHLYLHPEVIATGVGAQLLQIPRADLQTDGYDGMLLWTIEGNHRARSFFEAHRMQFDGTKDDQPEWLGEGVFEVRYTFPIY